MDLRLSPINGLEENPIKYEIKDMSKTAFAKLLKELDACAPAQKWCKGKTLKEAWSKSRVARAIRKHVKIVPK